jgi:hypothetical protein
MVRMTKNTFPKTNAEIYRCFSVFVSSHRCTSFLNVTLSRDRHMHPVQVGCRGVHDTTVKKWRPRTVEEYRAVILIHP